jgi:Tol biopolymer transport system component
MWSPDRTRIAFATRSPDRRSIAGELYVVNADGSDPRLLTDHFLPFAWPVWSPDGSRIAFSDPSAFNPMDGAGHIDLAVIELSTGVVTNVTGGRFDFATSPTWSPDGVRLAFTDRVRVQMGNGFDFSNGDVHLYNLASGALSNVTGNALQNERQVTWSPVDDRLLIYTDPGDWSSDDVGQLVIWDLATSETTIVPTAVRSPEPAIWSPDGTRLAWVEGTDVVKFWSAAGVEWVRLSTDVGPALTWAPDGHAIFAPATSQSGPSYVIAVDGQFGTRASLKLGFDLNNGSTGLPIWAPRSPMAAPVDGGGTALDKPLAVSR